MTTVTLTKAGAFAAHMADYDALAALIGDPNTWERTIPTAAPVPGGWWDTGARLGSGATERKIIAWGPPTRIFAGGEKGVFLDAARSPLWTDTGGTSSASVGQAIARIDDVSGNGLNATQASPAKQFILREDIGGRRYFELDGVDDRMLTGTLDMTHTDKVTVVAAISKASNPAGRGTVLNFPDNGLSSFTLEVPKAASTDTRWFYAGNVVAVEAAHTLALNTPVVYTGTADIGEPKIELRANGASAAANFSSPGTGNFRAGPFCIGDYVTPSGRFFHGRIYGLLVIDRILTPGEIAMVEAYMATRSGVTL